MLIDSARGISGDFAAVSVGGFTGAVVFDGGGLAVSNSFITSRAITLAQSGRVDVATGRTLLLAGGVSGGGDLIKTGAGTLHLTNGGNTYSNTRIQSGMLIGGATSVRGNVENHGTLVFQQWADGTFGGSLFGDGVLEKRPARAAQVHGGRPRLPHANLPPKKNRPFPGGAKERG